MNAPKKYRLLLSEFIDSLDEQIVDSSDKDILENANESEISKFDEIANKQIVAYRKNHKSRREKLKTGDWKTNKKRRRPPPKGITLW